MEQGERQPEERDRGEDAEEAAAEVEGREGDLEGSRTEESVMGGAGWGGERLEVVVGWVRRQWDEGWAVELKG